MSDNKQALAAEHARMRFEAVDSSARIAVQSIILHDWLGARRQLEAALVAVFEIIKEGDK
ncbi:MAG TPA: hypothetical protein VMQ76_13255 [Terracidiphilus sp.]|nr:hypothetical protein [Terracidiphilus sp.]